MNQRRSSGGQRDTIVFLTGYGDNTRNIRLLTWYWPILFGIQPVVHRCGTDRPATEYPKLLQEAKETIESVGRCVVAGQSFGGLIGATLLEKHPELVMGQITFSTPFQGAITREAVEGGDLSLLNRAARGVNQDIFTPENTLSYVGSTDDVAPPPTMLPKNATTEQLWIPGHGAAIAGALIIRAAAISRFTHERLQS